MRRKIRLDNGLGVCYDGNTIEKRNAKANDDY